MELTTSEKIQNLLEQIYTDWSEIDLKNELLNDWNLKYKINYFTLKIGKKGNEKPNYVKVELIRNEVLEWGWFLVEQIKEINGYVKLILDIHLRGE